MLLKLSRFLEKLSFKLRQKAIYFELKHYIKSGESYTKHIHSWERGIGKTYTLIQLAHKYKCPILVSTVSNKRHIQSSARDLNKKVEVIACQDSFSIRSRRSNLVLLEEGIDERIIYEYIKPCCKQMVGYYYIH